MVFKGNSAIEYLKKIMQDNDEASSAFWKYHHSSLVFDDEKFIGLEMLGTSKKRTVSNLLIYELVEKILQKPFIKEAKKDSQFIIIDSIARDISKRVNQIYSLDRLRHTLTLWLLQKQIPDFTSKASKTCIIGDGYATLTTLLIATKSASQVFLINLNKSLLVDLFYLKKYLGKVEFENSVSLVTTHDDLNEAILSGKKVIAIMASDYHLMQFCPVNLAVNIASMQEMDISVVNNYFKFMHVISNSNPFYFYCCNRVEKILDDGQVLRFEKFPWSKSDKIVVNEACPWHQRTYSIKPPFYRDYDGPVWHRLAQFS